MFRQGRGVASGGAWHWLRHRRSLASRKARGVAIADLASTQAEDVAAEFGENAFAVEVNVTNRASIDRMVADVASRWGGIDILVNNAAVFDMAPIVEVTASFDKVFAVNVKGLFFTLQAVAQHMIARSSGGKIINMASQVVGAARRSFRLIAPKAAVISLTQSAGLDLIKHRINVNGIAPGVVDTPMWDRVDSLFAKYEKQARREKRSPSAKPYRSAAWELPTTMSAPPSFLHPPTPTMWSRRRLMSTAAIG